MHLSRNKTINVFISSTFKDMHSERDYLIKNVFPRLREWCRKKKGLSLVELDLRWGVTEDEAKNGEVINICMEEIERSRPFFIGLMGDRYGWIPDEYQAPDGPILDWLKQQETYHSITSLEILKGVLDNPNMQNLAHFYFRDNSFIRDVPDTKRTEILPENNKSRIKQDNLKEEIKKLYIDTPENIRKYCPEYAGLKLNWKLAKIQLSKVLDSELIEKLKEVAEDEIIEPEEWSDLTQEVRELLLPYCVVYLSEESLKEFGDFVFNDLLNSIDSIFEDKPEWEDPLLEERQAHDDYRIEKTRLFVGRQSEILRSLSYLEVQSSEPSSPLYIWGSGGIGKSALTAKILELWSLQNLDIPVFTYFLGTTGNTLDLFSFLNFLYKELSSRLNIESDLFPEKKDEIIEFMNNFLGSIDTPCFILIDAIDQLNDCERASRFDWVPEKFCVGVHCLISSLPDYAVNRARELGFDLLEVKPLELFEQKDLVINYLSMFRKKLGFDSKAGVNQMELLLSKENAGHPLYLTVAAEELRISPRFEEITDRIKSFPETISNLFDQLMETLELDFGRILVKEAMGLWAVSRNGLTEEELLELLAANGEDRLAAMVWSSFFLRIRNYLKGVNSSGGVLGYFHREMYQAATNRYVSTEADRFYFNKKLGNYFISRAKGNDSEGTWVTGYKRGFSEGIYHLIKAELFDEINYIFNDFGFSIEKLKLGLLDSYIEDWNTIGKMISHKEYKNLYIWYRHIISNIHILKREDKIWPSHKILLQIAVEHGDNSPITMAAENWLGLDKCDWFWIRNQDRPENYFIDPCIAVLEGHKDYVNGALVRDDGVILSWSRDTTLRLWNPDGEALTVLEGHKDDVNGALVRDDGVILSWSRDTTLRLWNSDGEALTVLEGHTDYVDGAILRNDGTVLSWSRDTTLRLWNPDGEALTVLEGHKDDVEGAILRDDDSILSWSVDNTLRLWNSNGYEVAILEGHKAYVNGALVRDDGVILSWSMDTTLRLWNPDGEALTVLEGHTGIILGALVRCDGSILSWSVDGTLRLWNSDGEILSVFEENWETVYGALIMYDDSILSWGNHGVLRLWNPYGEPLQELNVGDYEQAVMGAIINKHGTIISWNENDSSLHLLKEYSPHITLLGHTHPLIGALFQDVDTILSWSEDGTLRLWDLDHVTLLTPEKYENWINGALTHDDGSILSWSVDGTLRLWSPDGEALAVLEGHTDAIIGALVMDDGSILSWSVDETLRMWSPEGEVMSVLEGHEETVIGALVRDDGSILSWSWDNTLFLWNSDGKLLSILKGHKERCIGHIGVLIRDDGSILSWSADRTLRLWSSDGDELAVLKDNDSSKLGALIRSDGTILSWGYKLRLWSSEGEVLAVLEGHEEKVIGALVRDDDSILSWSDDCTLRLWSPKGDTLAVLEGHKNDIEGVLTRDDGSILSWSADRTLRLWSSDGDVLAVLEGHEEEVYGALVRDDGSIISWSDSECFHWNYDGLQISSYTKVEGILRFPELHNQIKHTGVNENSILDTFEQNCDLYNFNTGKVSMISKWIAPGDCKFSFLFSNGKMKVSTDQESFDLQLYKGKSPIALDQIR